MSQLLSKTKVAEHFDVTISTIDRWMKVGYLPFIKLDRRVFFDPQEIEYIKDKYKVRAREAFKSEAEASIDKKD